MICQTKFLQWFILFADDTKLYKGISKNADRQQLQSDIDNLVTWSTKWKLLFNLDKCKVMTLGHPPDVSDYTMTQNDGKRISVQRSHLERLGNYNWQWAELLRTYGFLKSKWNYGSHQKNFYMSWLWVFQFAVQVIGQNTYGVTTWFPCKMKDIETIEKVQKRATKQVKQIRHLIYSERLKRLNLPTLRYDDTVVIWLRYIRSCTISMTKKSPQGFWIFQVTHQPEATP